jgi:hypothetical protein
VLTRIRRHVVVNAQNNMQGMKINEVLYSGKLSTFVNTGENMMRNAATSAERSASVQSARLNIPRFYLSVSCCITVLEIPLLSVEMSGEDWLLPGTSHASNRKQRTTKKSPRGGPNRKPRMRSGRKGRRSCRPRCTHTPRRPVAGICRRCCSEEGCGCNGGDDELTHFHLSVLEFKKDKKVEMI